MFFDPEGNLDSANRTDASHVRLVGWASDGDVAGPIQVQALLDGAMAGQATAGVLRGDVGAHGFDFTVATDWRGRQVCAKALNAGGGGVDKVLPGCTQVPYAICPDTAPTIVRAGPKEDIMGTGGDDVIWASGVGARIAGRLGNDIVCGGGSTGGPGGNKIIGGPGNNLIFTGPGDNDVVAGPGRTTVVSGGGAGLNRIAICPNTVVLNLGSSDEVRPSANCGGKRHSLRARWCPWPLPIQVPLHRTRVRPPLRRRARRSHPPSHRPAPFLRQRLHRQRLRGQCPVEAVQARQASVMWPRARKATTS